MSERTSGREKRGWKAVQLEYDVIMAMSTRLCSVCLSEQQIAALLGLTEMLGWSTRWNRPSGDVDPNIVRQFTDNLERQLTMACCDDQMPIQYRYSSSGTLQMSLNGGGNWTDAPQYDPRIYSPQFPPMSGADGADKKCIAATGAAALIKEQVGDQLTDDMSRYTLAQLITDWVKTYLQSSNPFEALLTVLANQIFALVIATLRPALTDAVYDTFKCILYCQIASDASFNDSSWQAVRSDITDQIGGIAGIFLEHLVYLLGSGGLTNVARAGGAATGDCSSCGDCGVCGSDWTAYDIGGGVSGANIVSFDAGVMIVDSVTSGGSQVICISSGDASRCCHITSVTVLSGGYSDFFDSIACGQTPVVGNLRFNVYLDCINTFAAFWTGAPFRLQIVFEAC